MSKTFTPGDVVRLKSGGPPMTVVYAQTETVSCVWFPSASDTPARDQFPPAALMLVEAK